MDQDKPAAKLLAGYPVVITLPVLWGDQDAFVHVNNTVYFRWFESSRIAYFERVGLLELLKAERIGPILASASCEYRRQVNFPDTVAIGVRATRIGRTSLRLEQAIVSRAQGAVVAEGVSTVVVFDYKAHRPHPVPESIRKAIQELEGKEL